MGVLSGRGGGRVRRELMMRVWGRGMQDGGCSQKRENHEIRERHERGSYSRRGFTWVNTDWDLGLGALISLLAEIALPTKSVRQECRFKTANCLHLT